MKIELELDKHGNLVMTGDLEGQKLLDESGHGRTAYVLGVALLWTIGFDIDKKAAHCDGYDCDSVAHAHKCIF